MWRSGATGPARLPDKIRAQIGRSSGSTVAAGICELGLFDFQVLVSALRRMSEGDHLPRYYADKRKSYPPDIEREPGREYVFRV